MIHNEHNTHVLLQQSIPCPVVPSNVIGKSYTIKEFVALFPAEDVASQFLKTVIFVLKSPFAIQYSECDEEHPELTSSMFKFTEEKRVYEPIYIFRLFANFEYIIMISDELLGAANRVKGIELILSKFKNEELTKFLDVIGADALDKAVTVALVYLFVKRSTHLINLYDIFEFMPKSLYVVYVNRLCQGSCILPIQKLVKYHKADMFGNDIYFSLTPRLFDLLGNQAIEMI
jgi:hypothetical protein